MSMFKPGSLGERRWRSFKSNRRAFYSLWVFLLLFVTCLFAELIANDKPLVVSYQGQHYQFDALEMNPAPSAHLPIWIGGISKPAMRRAARLGDGWVTDLQPSAEIIDSIEQIKLWRAEYGRGDQPFDIMATPSDAWDVDGYKRLEDAGVTHILTMPWPFYHGETDDLDKKIDSVKRYADDIISQFS